MSTPIRSPINPQPETPPQSGGSGRRNRSIASRLFQYALAGSGGAPTPQQVQQSQQETYNRLREQLFPNAASRRTADHRLQPSRERFEVNSSSRYQLIQSNISQHQNSVRRLLSQSAVRQTDFHQSHSDYNNNIATMHPSFRSKTVCQLGCNFCHLDICKRGMKAILLADTSVELYSTDNVSKGRVQLVGDDYLTENCNCKIRDVACLGCGNVVGYHVTQPCDLCLSSCNNGHFWMFLSENVFAKDRLDPSGMKALVWAQLREEELQRDVDHVVR